MSSGLNGLRYNLNITPHVLYYNNDFISVFFSWTLIDKYFLSRFYCSPPPGPEPPTTAFGPLTQLLLSAGVGWMRVGREDRPGEVSLRYKLVSWLAFPR
jgi:hypothetical protein